MMKWQQVNVFLGVAAIPGLRQAPLLVVDGALYFGFPQIPRPD
jgi:hypothetical protein